MPGARSEPVSFLDQRAGLAGKVAVVAGGGGGLGRAGALDLARAGVALALADIDGPSLTSTAEEARSHGVEVVESLADVRDPEALAGVFESCEQAFGRLDILVNVVGGTFRSPFTDVSPKGRDALVRTNFTWVVDATQRAARLMAAGGEPGEIVVAGGHVLPGYLNGEGDVETKFEVDGARWHRTGDLGYLDGAGRLWLL